MVSKDVNRTLKWGGKNTLQLAASFGDFESSFDVVQVDELELESELDKDQESLVLS